MPPPPQIPKVSSVTGQQKPATSTPLRNPFAVQPEQYCSRNLGDIGKLKSNIHLPTLTASMTIKATKVECCKQEWTPLLHTLALKPISIVSLSTLFTIVANFKNCSITLQITLPQIKWCICSLTLWIALTLSYQPTLQDSSECYLHSHPLILTMSRLTNSWQPTNNKSPITLNITKKGEEKEVTIQKWG